MGDGQVALILDVLGLAQQANVVSEVRDRSLQDKTKAVEKAEDRQTLLLFDTSSEARMAIPLSMVARLEEFPRSRIERSGRQNVVQYRGQILPLIDLAAQMSESSTPAATGDMMQVVVYSEQGRSIGLVVGRINDIVQQTLTVKRNSSRDGILGLAVIQGKVTDLLDIACIIGAADPSLLRRSETVKRLKPMTNTRQFCTFFLDGLFFGVEVLKVQEVIRYQEMTRVPLAPDTIRGLINLRGQIVTAIDLRHRLELPPRPDGQLPMNVVIRSEDGAVSLFVDEIGDVVEIDDDTYEHPPETLKGVARELVQGVYKLKDRLLLILDTEKTVCASSAGVLPPDTPHYRAKKTKLLRNQ